VARLRAVERPTLAVVAAMVVFVVVFTPLVWLRHDRYATFDFDLGIHDQSIWLLSRGLSFCTVRGLPVFGHHATFGYALLVPFYWLGTGPQFLNALQVVAVAVGAVPLYVLGRQRFGPAAAWSAAVLAGAWLLQWPLQFFVWETFHPEVVALPALMGAYVAAEREAYGWAAGLGLLALSWKEDVALAVIGLGLVWLLRRRWRLGAVAVGVGAAWFLVFAVWMVPALAGGGTVYGPLYGELGDTPSEVVTTGLRHPDLVLERLGDNDAVGYARDLLAPMAFTPLLAPELLLAGLPQAMVNLLSTASFTFDLRYHYAALPLAAAALAMVEGTARLVRRWPQTRHGIVGLVGACALAATCAWGPSPIGREYDSGYWPKRRSPQVDAYDAAVDLVDGDDGVSVDYVLVPHLTHREVVYTFPNPWISKNYGIGGEVGDPALVDWLVVNRALAGARERQLLEELLVGGEFVVRLDQAGIVAAERVRAPGAAGAG